MGPAADIANRISTYTFPRPRLTPIFDEAFRKSIVVVKGGAGTGKTEAVADYLSLKPYRPLWFRCEARDNLTTPFFRHFMRLVRPHLHDPKNRISRQEFPDTDQTFEAFIEALTEELYQNNQSLAFVFDDLHLITASPVLDFLFRFMTTRIVNITFVIITRSWPIFSTPFPTTPRVIGSDTLRFSQDETLEYFKTFGIELGPETLKTIHHYLSGWPIALSLFAFALSRQEKAEDFEKLLSDAKPSLFELFEMEIFSQYTSDEQELLVKLSALDSFPRGLVQGITGEGRRELPELLATNPFIIYDSDARRLSFHPLYQEFLLEKRSHLTKKALIETFDKAGNWCLEAGHHYDALHYFEVSNNHEKLWDTLMAINGARHTRSEADFLISRISALPTSFRKQHPMTNIVLSTLLINNFRLTEAETTLDNLFRELDAKKEENEILGEYYIARGFLLLAKEENGFEIAFKKAAALLPQGSQRYRKKITLVDLGPGLNLKHKEPGELKKSLNCFISGVPHMVKALHGVGGGLDELCLSEAAFLTGNVKKSTDHAYKALYAAESYGQYDIAGNALLILTRLNTLQGDYPRLMHTMEQVKHYQDDPKSAGLGIWDIIQSWFYADMGELGKVPAWIRNPVQKGYPPLSIDRAILVRLRILIGVGQYSETLALINQFEQLSAHEPSVITGLYLEICRSVTLYYLKRQREAMRALVCAYDLAKGNCLIMPFIESGTFTRSLLDYARKNNNQEIPQDWLDKVHARANTAAKRYATINGRFRLEQSGRQKDYDLSRRETELMVNLSQGLTREEIATSMGLSANTIKSLTKQTFAKLGAINAADAVRIAILNQLI